MVGFKREPALTVAARRRRFTTIGPNLLTLGMQVFAHDEPRAESGRGFSK